ncbi:MAG: response regulator [Bryobacteraceae bacterium]|nr:response regulator [Bryobacteraceae bacterium]
MSASRPFRVFVVEDNPGDVFLIREALRGKNLHFELEHFEDGEEAWRALSEQGGSAPDVILLDLNVPKTEGSTLLSRIRALPGFGETPIAILTSSQSPADERAAVALGANRFIRKASFLDEFLAEVGSAVSEMLGPQR